MLAAMLRRFGGAIVSGMENTTPIQETNRHVDDADDARSVEAELVRAWREEQLRRLGLLPTLARAFADSVDWHDVASLVRLGCPPMLALEIVL